MVYRAEKHLEYSIKTAFSDNALADDLVQSPEDDDGFHGMSTIPSPSPPSGIMTCGNATRSIRDAPGDR